MLSSRSCLGLWTSRADLLAFLRVQRLLEERARTPAASLLRGVFVTVCTSGAGGAGAGGGGSGDDGGGADGAPRALRMRQVASARLAPRGPGQSPWGADEGGAVLTLAGGGEVEARQVLDEAPPPVSAPRAASRMLGAAPSALRHGVVCGGRRHAPPRGRKAHRPALPALL